MDSSDWISVSERLPVDLTRVWVTVENESSPSETVTASFETVTALFETVTALFEMTGAWGAMFVAVSPANNGDVAFHGIMPQARNGGEDFKSSRWRGSGDVYRVTAWKPLSPP